jgi:hypothetical protein
LGPLLAAPAVKLVVVEAEELLNKYAARRHRHREDCVRERRGEQQRRQPRSIKRMAKSRTFPVFFVAPIFNF